MHDLPQTLLVLEGRSQRLVARHDQAERSAHVGLQRPCGQRDGNQQVETVSSPADVVDQPELALAVGGRNAHDIASKRRNRGQVVTRPGVTHPRCHRSQLRVVENIAYRQQAAKTLVDLATELDGDQRVATQSEETAVRPDRVFVHAEQRGPYLRHLPLDRICRNRSFLLHLGIEEKVIGKQGGTIQLSVFGDRPCGEAGIARRLHVVGQVSGNRATHLLQHIGNASIIGADNDECHELLRPRVQDDPRISHRLTSQDSLLHLCRIDTEAAGLDLHVAPTDELQPAVILPAHEIAGPIKSATRLEGIIHEGCRGEVGASEIATRHIFTTDMQLADGTQRQQFQPVAQHMNATADHRTADGDHIVEFGERAVHRGLGRTIGVEHAALGTSAVAAQCRKRGRRRIVAADDQMRPVPRLRKIRHQRSSEGGRCLEHLQSVQLDEIGDRRRVCHLRM
ncbi:hypothetical protein NB705_001703 [Xanthomonas sacchari]|nr:hypothetical protein [Xanthomonas sacchari]